MKTSTSRIEIDGAVLQVCQKCASRGVIVPTLVKTRPLGSPRTHSEGMGGVELEIDPEYHSIVKEARERMGLTQEALGRLMNVKPSLIKHIESKKMKPDLALARTLMHYLKVNLLVPSNELEGRG